MNKELTIEQELRKLKKIQILTIITLVAISVVIIVSLCLYFNLKQRAFIGSLFKHNTEIGKYAAEKLFNLHINSSNIAASKNGLEQCGYGHNGFYYLIRMSGESNAYILITAFYLIITIIGIIIVEKTFNTKYLNYIVETQAENAKLKKELNKEKDYNLRQQKTIQDFIENVAHQIKTPLAALVMKLELMMEMSKDETKQLLSDCTANAFRISGFIKTLLNISRLENKKVILAVSEDDISAVLIESIEKSDVDHNRIILDISDECKNATLYIDKLWLIEGFVNIISNSYNCIKDSEDGRVYINATCNDEQCRIIIADNGKGFSSSQIPQIFDRFHTFDNPSDDTKIDFHTGIGLNLSKLIIEAHFGHIKAGNSEEFGGAEFTISIPRYKLKKNINM